METATVKLNEAQWVRVLLALEFKAENDTVNTDKNYLEQFQILADEIRETVKAQVL